MRRFYFLPKSAVGLFSAPIVAAVLLSSACVTAPAVPFPAEGPALVAAPRTAVDAPRRPLASAMLPKLPVSFVANEGQADSSIRFQARAFGGRRLHLLASGLDVVLAPNSPSADSLAADSDVARRVGWEFLGRGAGADTSGVDPLPGVASFLSGSDPSGWQMGLATYAGVRYDGLYPGTTVRVDARGTDVELTFLLEPGADPDAVRWRITGAEEIAIDPAGGALDATVRDASGAVVGHFGASAPRAWQEGPAGREAVGVGYRFDRRGGLGFAIDAYDPARALWVDPVLTFLGGGGDDFATSVAVDALGDAYFAGETDSPDFPVTSEAYQRTRESDRQDRRDGFVVKLRPSTGEVLYSTYINGASLDAVAVDDLGAAYVAGRAWPGAPAIKAVQACGPSVDAFVLKLEPGGARPVYATCLGGSENPEKVTAIAVDAAGAAYVLGSTPSRDFPTRNAVGGSYGGLGDAFVVKVEPGGGALAFSTYLGGSDSDQPGGIAVHPDGGVVVVGHTRSGDFPVLSGAPSPSGFGDAFVSRLDGAGALTHSVLLGGPGSDGADDVAVDSDGSIYVVGTTYFGFPLVGPYRSTPMDTGDEGFLAKLTSDGASIVYSTYLGAMQGLLVVVDAAGQPIVGATTLEGALPTVNAQQTALAGDRDGYLVRLTSDGRRATYASYHGGADYDILDGLAIDQFGNIVIAGSTNSPDFPVRNSLQPYRGGSEDFGIDAFGGDVALGRAGGAGN